MISSLEAFKIFQLKMDKLDTEDTMDISPGEFVLMYNELQNKIIIEKYRNKTTRYVDDIQGIIEMKSLEKDKDLLSNDTVTHFTLPENYFDYISSSSIASNSNCNNRVLYNFEVKQVDLNVKLNDEFNKPSFDFGETIITINKNSISVYKDETFNIDKLNLTYYRFPKQIDIEGYIKINGDNSVNIDPELPDYLINEIIDRVVLEFQRNYKDQLGVQINQAKLAEGKQL